MLFANLLIATSLIFLLIGAGLFALTMSKQPSLPARANNSQLREHAERMAEMKKMRIAGYFMAGVAAVLLIVGLIS